MPSRTDFVKDYIRQVDSTLSDIFAFMQDGSITMSDAVWNKLEDRVEGSHLNYHPAVAAFLDEDRSGDDDDEQDAEDDDSDHIYDPYAFADGH